MTMENVEIAAVFDAVADLLEIQEANPFRVRAYRNAVRTIGDLGRPIAEMVAAEEDLTELPGIGRDIAGYIEELVATGELTLLEEISKASPETLTELLELERVGPKRAKVLWRELGVESVDELQVAIDEGRLEGLKGFGAKTVDKIRRSIDEFRVHVGPRRGRRDPRVPEHGGRHPRRRHAGSR